MTTGDRAEPWRASVRAPLEKQGPGIHPADLLGSRVIQQQAGAATGLPRAGTQRCCFARLQSYTVFSRDNN